MRAPDPMRLVDLGGDIEWIGSRVLIPASALAVVSGVLLVIDSDVWGFGDDWIVLGIVLFAITFLAGALFFGPESGRLGKLAEAEGPTSPAVPAKLQRLLALTRADLMLLILIIFDMAVKPSWGDGSLWIAVLAFAALAALLVRNGMKAQLGATPALEQR
jgi:peptidoglycan/LPS O-acetylase OafA/YrhL